MIPTYLIVLLHYTFINLLHTHHYISNLITMIAFISFDSFTKSSFEITHTWIFFVNLIHPYPQDPLNLFFASPLFIPITIDITMSIRI